MNKKLFKTKEEYDKAIEVLKNAPEPKLPEPSYPKSFPALLCSEVKFHRMYESTQDWVYLSDFTNGSLPEFVETLDKYSDENIDNADVKKAFKMCSDELKTLFQLKE